MIGITSTALILVGLLVWVLWRPSVALAAIVLMFALEQWAQFSNVFFLQNRTYVNYFVGFLVVLALLRLIASGHNPFNRHSRITVPIILLFLFALVSTAWTLAPEAANTYWQAQWPYMVTLLLLAPMVAQSARDFGAALVALMTFGAPLVGLLLVFGTWENRMLVLSSGAQTITGNPLAIAELSGAVLLAVTFYPPRIFGLARTAFRWIVALMCLALIVQSGSRGQLLGAVVAVLFAWPISHRVRNPLNFLAWGCAAVALVVGAEWAIQEFGAGNIRWSAEQIGTDVAGRFDNSVRVLGAWADSNSFFFGIGNSSSFAVIGNYPHNVPVEILSEEGVFGLILFCAALLFAHGSFRRARRACEIGSQARQVLAFLVANVLFSFVLMLKQGSLLGSLNFFMFVMLLGTFERGLALAIRRGRVDAAFSAVPIDRAYGPGVLAGTGAANHA